MKSRDLKAFIRRSINAGSVPPNVGELQRLLDQMSIEEMEGFWRNFAADRAFSATSTVPHWKTKEQLVRFQDEHRGWIFSPKEKDATGNYIIVEKEFEAHIKTCLLKYIQSERESLIAYRRLPLFHRIHKMIGAAVVILLIPACICQFLADNKCFLDLSRGCVLFFNLLWCLYLFLVLIRSLIRLFRVQKDTQHGT